MKKVLFFVFLSIVFAGPVSAQFIADLAGYPLVTTGWTIGGFATVVDSTIQLTTPSTTENGYVYYATPVNLTDCGQFNVDFDYKIKVSPSSSVADGIAFWYISNPPSGFITGGGIGLPTDANGLIMIMDTYDNTAPVNVPLETLLGYNGTIAGYTEGSTAGLLCPVVGTQTYITDGTWHHCKITYNAGIVNVFFNYSTTATLTGTYPLAIAGYFGFSSSTGAAYSTQSVKSVHITALTALGLPTVTSPVHYCVGDTPSPVSATADPGGVLHWYTTDTATVISLPAAPTPSTATPGTYTYYVRQSAGSCISPPDSVKVTVNAIPPAPTITGTTVYCEDATFIPFTATGTGILWYTASTGGTGTATAPVVPTGTPGSSIYYASQTVLGCESPRASIQVTVHTTPAAPVRTAGDTTYCQFETFVPFTVTGSNILWYTSPAGGTGSGTAPVVNTSVAGVYNYYVTQTDTGCESPRLHIPVTVYAKPATPVVADLTYCEYATATALTATATGTLTWYGPGVTAPYGTAATPATAPTGTSTYYVTQTINGCVSDSASLSVVIDSTPVTPTIGSNAPICSGNTLNLTSDDATAGVGFGWAGPAGFTSGLQNPSIPAAPVSVSGVYTVTATLDGCTATNTINVLVKPTPVAPVATTNSPVCSGGALNFTATSDAGSLYSWNGPNFFGTTVQNPVIDPAITAYTGNYTVTATVNGCISPATIIYAEVDSTPGALVVGTNSAGPPAPGVSICQNDTLKLFANDATTGLTYTWSGPSAFSSTEANPVIPHADPAIVNGTYTITVGSGTSCTSTALVTVTVTPTPPLIASSNSPVCTGDTLKLFATSDAGAVYTWSGPYVFISGAQNPTRAPAIMEYGGEYLVSVLVNNCTAHAATTVVMHQTPNPPVMAWLTYCQNYGAWPLMASGDNILWYTSAAAGSVGSPIAPIPSTTTVGSSYYYASQTVLGCTSIIDSGKITINPIPTVTVSPDTSICPRDSAVLRAVDTDAIAYYQWYPDQYLNNATSATVVSRPETNVHYAVVASNGYDCKDTAWVAVTVHPNPVINMPDSVRIYPGESYQISPQTNATTALWFPPGGLSNPHVFDPVATPEVNTKYILYASTEWGCVTKDSIDIYVSTETLLDAPNAFTPGAGSNDIFKLLKRGIAVLHSFNIYDRWGVLVFSTTDIDKGWDGKYNGTPQPMGVYVYQVEAETSTGTKFTKHGNVTLIR